MGWEIDAESNEPIYEYLATTVPLEFDIFTEWLVMWADDPEMVAWMPVPGTEDPREYVTVCDDCMVAVRFSADSNKQSLHVTKVVRITDMVQGL